MNPSVLNKEKFDDKVSTAIEQRLGAEEEKPTDGDESEEERFPEPDKGI